MNLKCFHSSSTLRLHSLFFHVDRNARHHKHHFICPCSNVLVYPPLKVSEFPLNFIFRSSSHAYFVGHKNKSSLLAHQLIELLLHRLQSLVNISLQVKKAIGTPQRHTINQYHSVSQRMTAEPLFLLQISPLGSPVALMPKHALLEFIVPNTGRG